MQTRHYRKRPPCAPANPLQSRIAQDFSLQRLAYLLLEEHVRGLQDYETGSTIGASVGTPTSSVDSTVLVSIDEFSLLGPGLHPHLVTGALSGTRCVMANPEELIGQHGTPETFLAVLLTAKEAVIATRSGRLASARLHPDACGSDISAGSPGLLSDVLLRYLGCATPPESTDPATLGMQQWLTLAVSMAAEPPPLPSSVVPTEAQRWEALAALHPSFDGDTDPNVLGSQALADTAEWTWEELRAATARGDAVIAEASEREATWMDSGSFARWLLASYQSVTSLVEDLRYFVDEYCHQQVVATLRASGWLGFE
ncbi:MAG TPA: hypothetical protein DEG43_08775 [Acidimicrobiaceae bacterium]|jgi:hypothetical protein|nr:hypothetical protein [Acidimicrobiaceae bacterium]